VWNKLLYAWETWVSGKVEHKRKKDIVETCRCGWMPRLKSTHKIVNEKSYQGIEEERTI
jgi:hypothetical protein